uniref:Lipase_3 domain-containing protein n=1 Tax=Syphacia muris TaxID=451379 RepID=A0A0N5AVP2_9BILA
MTDCGIIRKADCPLEIDPKYAYNDSFARYAMYPLAAAAAAEKDSRPCLQKAASDAKLRRYVIVPSFTNKTLYAGLVAVSEEKKAIMLAFRGTDSIEQFYDEGVMMMSLRDMKRGGKVNRYYYETFKYIWKEGLEKAVVESRKLYPNYEFWVTGISLGGAMATVAANVLVNEGISEAKNIKLVTFGEPRTGNQQFSEIHDKTFPYTYRITHAQDVVPHIPPKLLFGYYHHRYEVWYNNDMRPGKKYKICLSPEDCECSNSGINYDIPDHMSYFNIFTFKFIDNDCNYEQKS